VSKVPLRNLQYLRLPPLGIILGMLLRNNTTLLEATMTNIRDEPHCDRKGTRQYHVSQISSIPFTPTWVSRTPNNIWCSSTITFCIDTSKQESSFWTSHHWERHFNMLSKSSRNLNRRSESLDLQFPHNRSRVKATPTHIKKDRVRMDNLRTTSQRRKQRRVMRRRRKTLGSGVNSIKSPGITSMNVARSSR
jgi:hypothetical protein